MRKISPIAVSKLDYFVANIKATYYQALQYPTLASNGLNWYFNANAIAASLAKRHDTTLEIACGTIAALSPNNRWDRNLVDADLLLKHYKLGDKLDSFKVATYNHNKEKGWQITHGIDPLDALKGDKTRSFYLCLLNPSDSYTVCIDGHATNIALGKQTTLEKAPALTTAKYDLLADAYRIATTEINRDSLETNVLPMQVQAITWTLYRVLRGIDNTHVIN